MSLNNKPKARKEALQVSPNDQQEIQQRFNQLVADVRVLESYYQEIVNREQTVSAVLVETRAALESYNELSKNETNELLVPIGSGSLIKATCGKIDKVVVSVGAGVAIEKAGSDAKAFLESRLKDLEKSGASLEQQRQEIASRLEVGRQTLQRITESVQ
ncbi:MAG: prefoldin subunit alpha [Nitrososphaerales archaeon]